MTQFDVYLTAGTALVSLLLALGVLAAVAGTRRPRRDPAVSVAVDELIDQATTDDLEALMRAIRDHDDEETQ